MSDEWATITPNKGEQEEKVEFEIEGEEGQDEQLQLELDTENKEEDKEPTKKVEKKAQAPESEEQEALEGVETSGAQKRIRQLVQQKKEREAEIEKLIEENKQMQLRLQEREEEYKKTLGDNTATNARQAAERVELAKNAYRSALESGDPDKIVAAQEILTNAQQDNIKIAEFQKQIENLQTYQAQAQQQQQPANQQQGYTAAQRKAIQWASKNEWFNNDRILTAAALEIDNQIQEEGYSPEDDEYYEEIEKRMALQFPHKFGITEEAETPRAKATSSPSQVVAGASLAPKTSSGKKVKLTQEDVRLAQKWGISLEQYAAEKLKIESAEEGAYTTIR
jgi:hypothetical protein